MSSIEFKETIFIKFWYSFLKIFLGPIIKLIWIKKIEGLENIPKTGSCIIAANHSSYFDFICLVSVIPRRIYYLAAEKFFKSFFWRPLMAITGQIKVERNAKDKTEPLSLATSVLKNGLVLGIFPEGTRSGNGKMHKAYTGIGRFVITAETAVVPVGIKGTYEILPRFRKTPKFKKIVELNIGKPMFFKDFYGKENSEKTLNEITDRIMIEIAKLSDQKYNYA